MTSLVHVSLVGPLQERRGKMKQFYKSPCSLLISFTPPIYRLAIEQTGRTHDLYLYLYFVFCIFVFLHPPSIGWQADRVTSGWLTSPIHTHCIPWPFWIRLQIHKYIYKYTPQIPTITFLELITNTYMQLR